MLNNSIDCPELVSKFNLRTNRIGFRQRPLLQVPFATTNYRRNAYCIRAALGFNKLPRNLNFDLFCTSADTVRKHLTNEYFLDTSEK